MCRRVADAAAGLHGPVGGVARQPVGPVVAHGDEVGDLHVVVLVERAGRRADELAQHRRLGVQLDERELDALVRRQLLVPGGPAVGVGDGLVDAELRGAERRRGLADAVLVDERLGQVEAVIDPTEHRVGADPHVGHRDLGVVGRHVERPPEEVDARTRARRTARGRR